MLMAVDVPRTNSYKPTYIPIFQNILLKQLSGPVFHNKVKEYEILFNIQKYISVYRKKLNIMYI